MNEAIVKGGEWRQQGEEGRLGWPVYWLYNMFSWPAYYSDLSSLHPLSEELELELLRTISQNAMEQHIQIKGVGVVVGDLLNKNRSSLFFLCLHYLCVSTLNEVEFYVISRVTPSLKLCLSLLQQLSTRGHRCATFSGTELLIWVSHYHVKRVRPRDFLFSLLV